MQQSEDFHQNKNASRMYNNKQNNLVKPDVVEMNKSI